MRLMIATTVLALPVMAAADPADGERLDLIEDPDALRELAADLEAALAESDLLENLADMVIALEKRVDIVESDTGVRLSFDGEEIGGVEVERDVTRDEVVRLFALGRDLLIRREAANGKTRIILEMGSDDHDEPGEGFGN